MKQKYLMIFTPYGERFLVNAKGEITQYSETPEFSGDWLFQGLAKTHPFSGRLEIAFADLPEDLNTIDWKFKNGKPRYTAADNDHGTRRVWGNTQYHGIIRMTWVEF